MILLNLLFTRGFNLDLSYKLFNKVILSKCKQKINSEFLIEKQSWVIYLKFVHKNESQGCN